MPSVYAVELQSLSRCSTVFKVRLFRNLNCLCQPLFLNLSQYTTLVGLKVTIITKVYSIWTSLFCQEEGLTFLEDFLLILAGSKCLPWCLCTFVEKNPQHGGGMGGRCPNKRGVFTRVPPEKNGQEVHHYESERDENEEIALKSWQDVRPHWKGKRLVSLPGQWAVSGQPHKLPL